MPRRKSTDWEKDQALFGNRSPSQMAVSKKADLLLEQTFMKGISRMSGILEGENEGAAVAAFKAVADLYDARQRLQSARLSRGQKMSKAEKMADLVDLLKSLSQDERAQVMDLASQEADGHPAPADVALLADVAKLESL